ncbi:MAG: histidine kinase, partial [Lachnospiraceae bacterium]|nr:histidine kinase [Lachnospiraceae bacterium]
MKKNALDCRIRILFRIILGIVLFLLMPLFSTVGTVCGEDGSPLLNSSGVVNRSISVDPIGKSEGYAAVLYDNRNGLPTSEANAITETSDGFIWIGSYAGLIRYDGNTFERIDLGGLASIKCLFVDSRDRLWIGTNDNGVAVMERGEIRKWGKLDGMKSAHTRAIAEDRSGTIYIATTSGITMIDPEYHLTQLEGDNISEANMRDLRMSKDKVIYGTTDSGEIMIIRDGILLKYLSLDDSPIGRAGTIIPDPETEGRIYMEAGDFGLYYVDLSNGITVLEKIEIDPLIYLKAMEYIE